MTGLDTELEKGAQCQITEIGSRAESLLGWTSHGEVWAGRRGGLLDWQLFFFSF